MKDIEFKVNTYYKLSNTQMQYIIYINALNDIDKGVYYSYYKWGVKYIKRITEKQWDCISSMAYHSRSWLFKFIRLYELSVEEMGESDMVLELL